MKKTYKGLLDRFKSAPFAHIDGFQGGYINGWCKEINGQKAILNVYINGIKKLTIRADKYRKDLDQKFNSGYISYSISIRLLSIKLKKGEKFILTIEPEKSADSRYSKSYKLNSNEVARHFCSLDFNFDESIEVVKASGLWDEAFYVRQLEEIELRGIEPIDHFIMYGASENLNPSSEFSLKTYKNINKDVEVKNINPLFHYVLVGEREGRCPNNFFSPTDYLKNNPDLNSFDGCLYGHYIKYGKFEGRLINEEINLNKKNNSSEQSKNRTLINSYEEFEALEVCADKLHSEKVIAFYLPQFHPFEENDQWWGKGFTEWRNVVNSKSLLDNHYQPRLPSDLGYYDLRLKETLISQAELAKNIGVQSFCYYYYWFNGKVLMEQPIEILFENKEIDIEFCICWANENWTRAWDGLEEDILIQQQYSDKDDIEFIEKISKYFDDKRYTRVDGRPLVIIYRPSLFPNMRKTIKRWRSWAKKNKFGNLFVAMVQFDDLDPKKYGFDAALEFPPHQVSTEDIKNHLIFNQEFNGSVHDYSGMVQKSLNKYDGENLVFKGVTASWDNTARRGSNSSFFINYTPGRLAKWLEGIKKQYSSESRPNRFRIIFFNAWNEWAEGTFLEPDQKNGYATANVISRLNKNRDSNFNIGVVIHVYYLDLIDEIINHLKHLDNNFDILATCPAEIYSKVLLRMSGEFPDSLVDVKIVENKGRDIAPFMTRHVESYFRYDLLCKIHTKKSLHAQGINNWRQYLFGSLLGSKKNIEFILNEFENNENLGLLYPDYTDDISPFIEWGSNKYRSEELLKAMSIEMPIELKDFPAGSMFWCRPGAIKSLLNLGWKENDFDSEEGQIDGTVMHAIERVFGLVVESSGYICRKHQADSFGRDME